MTSLCRSEVTDSGIILKSTHMEYGAYQKPAIAGFFVYEEFLLLLKSRLILSLIG